MQRIIYSLANGSLFVTKITEESGVGITLQFPEKMEGVCHFGKEKKRLSLAKVTLDGATLVRGTYPVFVEAEGVKIGAEPLYFENGTLRTLTSPEMSRMIYELALLKDECRALAGEVEELKRAVFRTVIF